MQLLTKFTLWIFKKMSELSMDRLYRIAEIMTIAASTFRIFPFNRNIRNSLNAAFPEYSQETLKEIEKKHYKCLCENVAEFIASSRYTCEEMKQKMRYKNLEILDELFKTHKFVICYCGHMSGYELFTGLPLWRENYGMCNYYQATPDNQQIEEWACQRRERFGAEGIPIQTPLRKILCIKQQLESGTTTKRGYVLGSLADFPPKDSSATGSFFFFNKRIKGLVGTERIGKKIDAAYVYARMLRVGRGEYEVELIPLHNQQDDSPYQHTQAFYRELEKNIRLQPEIWLMWAYSNLTERS